MGRSQLRVNFFQLKSQIGLTDDIDEGIVIRCVAERVRSFGSKVYKVVA